MKIGTARDEPADALLMCWHGAMLGALEGYRAEEWAIMMRLRERAARALEVRQDRRR